MTTPQPTKRVTKEQYITYSPIAAESLEKMKASIESRGYTFNLKAGMTIAAKDVLVAPKAAGANLVPMFNITLPDNLVEELDNIQAYVSGLIEKEFPESEIKHYSRKGLEIPITFARSGVVNGIVPLTAPHYGKDHFPFNCTLSGVTLVISISISAKLTSLGGIVVFYSYNVEKGTYERITKSKASITCDTANICRL